MGRLIDTDELLARISLNYNNHQVLDAYAIKDIVNTTKTAYDVEKVVVELEKEKEIHTEHYNISLYKDYPEVKRRYEQNCGVIEKSIDIVKRGGVDGKE